MKSQNILWLGGLSERRLILGSTICFCLCLFHVVLVSYQQQNELDGRAEMMMDPGTRVAMGNFGAGDGHWPLPRAPEPAWNLGSTHWIYERDYGKGRPTTGVWADCNSPSACAKARAVKPKAPVPRAVPPIPPPNPPPAVVEIVKPPPAPIPPPAAPAKPDKVAFVPPRAAPRPPKTRARVPVAVQPASAPEPAEEPAPVEEEPEPEPQPSDSGCTPPCLFVPIRPDGGYPKLPLSGGDFNVLGRGQGAYVGSVGQAPQPAPYGQPYVAAGITGSLANPLLPMSWSSEDAAEHTLNLEQWRVGILKAQLAQANLRKQILRVSRPPEVARIDSRRRPRRSTSSKGKTAMELAKMKRSLEALAKDTIGAVSELRKSVGELKRGEKRKPPSKLAQLREYDEEEEGRERGQRWREPVREAREQGENRERSHNDHSLVLEEHEVDSVKQQLDALRSKVSSLQARREEAKEDQEKRTLALARVKTVSVLKNLLRRVDATISAREKDGTKEVLSQLPVASALSSSAPSTITATQVHDGEKAPTASLPKAVGAGASNVAKIEQIQAIKRGADHELNALLRSVDSMSTPTSGGG